MRQPLGKTKFQIDQQTKTARILIQIYREKKKCLYTLFRMEIAFNDRLTVIQTKHDASLVTDKDLTRIYISFFFHWLTYIRLVIVSAIAMIFDIRREGMEN